MSEENFLMTPGSSAMIGTLVTPIKDAGSARKELRFDEAFQQVPALLRAPYLLGNNLLGEDKEDEEEVPHEKQGNLSEEEVAQSLLWNLLGIGPFPVSVCSSHAAVVMRLKPICLAYADCLRTVHKWAFGQACCLAKEGFAWALDAVLQKEYRPRVVILEQQLLLNSVGGHLPKIVQASVGLHQLIVPLQQICLAVEQMRSSAEVMQLLHDKWFASIEPSRSTWSFLLFGASRPYFERISSWIAGNELRDPFDELFAVAVKETDSVVLRTGPRHLPRFLKRETAVLMLECGQHAHMLRKLNRLETFEAVLSERSLPEFALPEWTPESNASMFVASVTDLNARLGVQVLSVTQRDGLLRTSLDRIAQVCLMQRPSSWLQYLPLEENVLDASLPRLQQLVELALGSGVKVGLRGSLAEERARAVSPAGVWQGDNDATSSSSLRLTVRKALVMEIEARWPLTLLVPREALRCYALLGRRLLQYECLLQQLNRAFLILLRQSGVVHAMSVVRSAQSIVTALQRHFERAHTGPWRRLLSEAENGASLQEVAKQLSLHLRGCLCALFITVQSSCAEALEMLLDTCEALSVFVSQHQHQAGVGAPEMQSLLTSAVGAFMQHIRAEPESEALVVELNAATKAS